jgi:aryl-alcohol dehydrogenase-like predicted oxidoreductase
MALDHYVTLGKSGLRVSPLCLGTMTFGMDWGWGSTEADSHKILQKYIDDGGNFIDTANLYTKGHSEAIIGDFISKKGFRRDQLVIATKFFGSLYQGDPHGGGASRKSIYAALDASLRRLKTDYIDLYWMHCWDRFTPIEETMRTLDDLVKAGKIRYIGFSDTPAWKTAQAQMEAKFRGWAPLIALQIEYSLIERTVEGELIPMALELGLGVTPWSPLKGGILTGKFTRGNACKAKADRGEWVTNYLTDANYGIVDELIAISKEVGETPAKIALAWVQSKPGVISSIFGARTIEQLEDNIGALKVQLSQEQIAKLDAVSKPKLNFPAEFLNRAGSFGSGGTTINGVTSPINPLSPQKDDERYDQPALSLR